MSTRLCPVCGKMFDLCLDYGEKSTCGYCGMGYVYCAEAKEATDGLVPLLCAGDWYVLRERRIHTFRLRLPNGVLWEQEHSTYYAGQGGSDA